MNENTTLTHIDENGKAVMVDVSGKQETERLRWCIAYRLCTWQEAWSVC